MLNKMNIGVEKKNVNLPGGKEKDIRIFVQKVPEELPVA